MKRAWSVCMRMILAAFYSHPWAWNEIGFGGPAYPRGYMRLGPTSTLEPFERPGATDEDPVRVVARRRRMIRHLLKGAVGPKDNDSRFLLDVHRRDLPGEDTMRRYDDSDEVDICIVGAGAGGSVLAQRLARAGWKVVIIEAGPFWHPDEDWVSDEAGSHQLYWTEKRIIGGADPIETGQEQLRARRRRVDGPLRRATVPAFTPPTSRPRRSTASARTGRSPTRTSAPTTKRSKPSCPWPARTGRGAIPTPIRSRPTRSPRPPRCCGAAPSSRASRCGSDRSASSTAPSGTARTASTGAIACRAARSTPRPARTSPTCPTRSPTRVEIRADCMAARVEIDPASGRATGVTYISEGEQVERLQRAKVVAVAGYSIETPRLLLNSAIKALSRTGYATTRTRSAATSWSRAPRRPRGASRPSCACTRRRRPRSPPRTSTRPTRSRGFARGFSIQTVSPEPIGWAEHVLADGHWGRALREYMRDYNHWTTIGVLNELLAQPDNRVTLAEEKDPYGLPVARFDYSLCDNDKANIAYSTKVITDILHAAGAQDILTIQRYAHLIGGARMGTSPDNSVVDANQRSWAVPNLYLSDGSVCPTQGSANPALTIMALASRLGEHLAANRPA